MHYVKPFVKCNFIAHTLYTHTHTKLNACEHLCKEEEKQQSPANNLYPLHFDLRSVACYFGRTQSELLPIHFTMASDVNVPLSRMLSLVIVTQITLFVVIFDFLWDFVE